MNIIFGVYNGYNSLKTPKGGLYYFLTSLRKYNNTCRVVIICETTHIFQELKDFCDAMNCELYTDFNLQNRQMMFYRFAIYQKYLNESKLSFHKILLSDLNDVIFQDDPFIISFSEKQELYIAPEQNILSDRQNSSSNLNSFWIRQCDSLLSDIDYQLFYNKPVICAGTILGTYQGITSYLKFYLKLQQHCNYTLNDQALLNIYLYQYLLIKLAQDKISMTELLNYQNSRILTLDKVDFNTLNLDPNNGEILNKNGEKYIIIHQIDRCHQEYMIGLIK